jgi:glycerol-3-phosphate acyltransferase PlsY
MPWIILAIIISYALGSIPTAYIFGRLLRGIDIRKFGSGNVGATNALRVLGRGPGILVLLLDIG